MHNYRLAFVLPNVSGGGAARVAAILCGEWAKAGHEVHLVTYEEPGTIPFYPLNERIVRHQIGLSVSPKGVLGFISNNARRVLRLRRTLRRIRPAAVIAFLSEANITAVLASRGLGVPVLISERTHPGHAKLSALRSAARRFTYPQATRLCVQTEEVRDWYFRNLGVETSVIPNPVSRPEVDEEEQGTARTDRRRVVSLGRLHPVKGFDRLIDAFAKIAPEAPDWDLVIHGEGEERAALEQQIARLGLQDRIFLPGATRTPMTALRTSHLYVHSALYEGFPNAVLEALAAGLCVVATECPGGTGEILQGGNHGILVPVGDTEALAAAMLRTMRDDALRASFAARAYDAARVFAPDAIAARWLQEIERHATAA